MASEQPVNEHGFTASSQSAPQQPFLQLPVGTSSSGGSSSAPGTVVTSLKDQHAERLANRSPEQLDEDLALIKGQLAANKDEIDDVSDNLLSLVVLIKGDDLTALQNDDIEEKQKIMQ